VTWRQEAGGRGAGKERRAANVGGEGIGHDFVAPSTLQTSDGLKGVVEASGENRVSSSVATRRVNRIEEALGDLHRVVFWRKENAKFGTRSHEEKRRVLRFRYASR